MVTSATAAAWPPPGRAAEGAFNVSTLREPYRIEGKKTLGFELAVQFGWTMPDVIIYPTGGGTGLIGMWKAFTELIAPAGCRVRRRGSTRCSPAGCAPVVRAFESGRRPRASRGPIRYGGRRAARAGAAR